jgi:hypothetical protein
MTSILHHISRRPDVSFYRNGRVDITSHIARQLTLAEGDIIDICANAGEYYIYIRHRRADAIGRHRAVCRPTKTGSRNFRAYSVPLAHAMLRLTGLKDMARFPCGTPQHHPEKGIIIPIITKMTL